MGSEMCIRDRVNPDTPLREGMRLMVKNRSPLPVVEDDGSNKMVGIISSQSVVATLMAVKNDIDAGVYDEQLKSQDS